jgi:patatin-like phospholipase/acyl hydrolase
LAIVAPPTSALNSQFLHKRYNPNLEEVRILSIDGGGIKGVIPLTVLGRIETVTNQTISENFDIIAGTSAGCILSTGLSAPKDPTQKVWQSYSTQELLTAFVNNAPTFFSKMRLRPSLYDPSTLEILAEKFLGDTTFSQSLIPRVATAFDETTLTTKIFSSEDEDDHFAKDIALASSAVPMIFPKRVFSPIGRTSPVHTLRDGGLLDNNPTADAIAVARRIYPKANKFRVISLGDGRADQKNANTRILAYADILSQLFNFEFIPYESENNLFLSKIFGDDYVRINPTIAKKNNNIMNGSPENIRALIQQTNDYLDSPEGSYQFNKLLELIKKK